MHDVGTSEGRAAGEVNCVDADNGTVVCVWRASEGSVEAMFVAQQPPEGRRCGGCGSGCHWRADMGHIDSNRRTCTCGRGESV